MADYFNGDNWSSPRTLALLGAASGFLDPRGGMAAGFQGAMQGMNAGNQLQQIQALANQRAIKLDREKSIRQALKDTMKEHNNDPLKASNALIASGDPDIMAHGFAIQKSLPTAKTYLKGKDAQGNPVYLAGMSTGETRETGVTPLEKPMQINTGSEMLLLDPHTRQKLAAFGMGMSPGEGARLSQSERQFAQSHGLAQQNSAISLLKAQQAIEQANRPEFKDGSWITRPNAENPQGSIVPTEFAVAPKGSDADKARSSAKVKEVLGNDVEQLIKSATGSLIGAGIDLAGSVVGATTPGAKANATLKTRAATLAGNMPRFEGPQSDTDRQYYQEMAGDLGNPLKTDVEKLMALKELRRMHNLADSNGVVDSSKSKGKGASGSFANDDHLWGQVNTK